MVDRKRLLGDLHALREFGAAPNHPLGVIRPTFSNADMESREWLRQRMEDAGLDASIDGVGNVRDCRTSTDVSPHRTPATHRAAPMP